MPSEDQILTDGRNTVGGRVGDPGRLNRLVERVGFLASGPPRIGAGRDFCRRAEALGDRGRNAGKAGGEKLGHRCGVGLVHHGRQATELDPIGMRFDLFGFRGEEVGAAFVGTLVAVWIAIVEPDMRIGDRRLLEVLVHASAAANGTSIRVRS